MSRFLVRADGPDAPGIVAAITGPIADRGYFIEDTSTTRLSGHFAILLVVTTPDGETTDSLRQVFADAIEHFALDVLLEEIVEDARSVTGDPWAITVSGSERPGVVSAISRHLADLGVNIEDLSTRIVGSKSSSYSVLFDVVVPRHVDADRLVGDLSRLAKDLGVSCDAQRVPKR